MGFEIVGRCVRTSQRDSIERKPRSPQRLSMVTYQYIAIIFTAFTSRRLSAKETKTLNAGGGR